MKNGEELYRYHRIVEELKDNILSGHYVPGGPFPSVKMISRRFKVSHLTAVKALDVLKNAGLVKTREGVGTFVSKRMKFIGLLIPRLSQVDMFNPVVREISRLAQEKGIGLDFAVITESSFTKINELTIATARRMASSALSGVVFRPLDFGCRANAVNKSVKSLFMKANVPLVLMDSDVEYSKVHSRYDFIGVDNRGIGEAVGRHVLAQGARSIAFVAWSDMPGNVESRLKGLLSVIEDTQGATFSGRYFLQGDQEEMMKCWRRKLPDAIVCSSDLVAAHILKLLLKINKCVPKDVIVTGINDVDLSRLVSPPLTTVRQPCEEIARAAFETLLWRAENKDAIPRRILLATELIARESTLQK